MVKNDRNYDLRRHPSEVSVSGNEVEVNLVGSAKPIHSPPNDQAVSNNVSPLTKEIELSSLKQLPPTHSVKSLTPETTTSPESEDGGGHGGHHGPVKQTGKFGAITNYLNTILGAGIIGIPFAIKESGLVAGVALLLFVAFLTDKSLRLIVESARHHPVLRDKKVTSFEDLMAYTFGDSGSCFILWCMFIIAYGSMVAYLLVIKDTIPVIFKLFGVDLLEGGHFEGENETLDRDLILIATSICIVLPLSMLRDLASLAFTSFLSIFSAILTVCLTIIISPIEQNVADNGGILEVVKENWIKPSIFIGLSIMSDAFACHHAAYIVYGSLRKPSRRRWSIVTCFSIGLAAFIFSLFGLAGYLGYMEETQANVLNNFPVDGIMPNIARTLLTLTFFFTYPMEAIVGRHVLFALMHGEGASMENKSCCNWRHLMTSSVYVLTLVPALLFDDLGPVLALTGAIGGSCLAYITPGALYLGVYGNEFLAYCAVLLGKSWEKSNLLSAEHEMSKEDKPKVRDSEGKINLDIMEMPMAGGRMDMIKLTKASKPWWWYPLGFPIWCGVASRGRDCLNKKVAKLTYEDMERSSLKASPLQPHQELPILMSSWACAQDGNDFQVPCHLDFSALVDLVEDGGDGADEDLVRPTKWDFAIAVFYILFGIAAGVAGVLDTIKDILEKSGAEEVAD